jgi:hypothetical protein
MGRMVRVALVASLLSLSACVSVPENVGLECQRAPANGQEVREGEDPLAPGGPLAGRDVAAMNAAAVGDIAEAAGFEVTYRYSYDVGPQPEHGSMGYAECWCEPPPGRVYAVAYDSIGRIVVMADSGQSRDAVRPQPTMGWGCEGEAEGARSS